MVTAGVYLLIRFNNLIINNILVINLIIIISLITIFLSGLGANFEFDLKKIIALSTLSQLGVIIFCLSLGLSEISLFHLLTHAIFKSILFLCSGVIIHNILDNQDIRYIRIVIYNIPLVSILFNCSTISLCGIPFISGFFSKDLILEIYLIRKLNKLILIILFISIGLTVIYSIRLIYYRFIKNPQLIINLNSKIYRRKILISIYLLFFSSIIIGLNLSWILFSIKNLIFLTIELKLIIYIFIILGIIIGYFIPKFILKNRILKFLNIYIKFFIILWFIPLLYGFKTFEIINFRNKIIFYIEIGWVETLIGINIVIFIKKLFKLDYYYKRIFNLIIIILYFLLILFIIIYLNSLKLKFNIEDIKMIIKSLNKFINKRLLIL